MGKTTRLGELFAETENARGFRSEKIHDCGRVTAYELTDMRTGETMAIARLASLPTPDEWHDPINHGPFVFNRRAFRWAEELLDAAVEDGAGSVFIDELGKLELKESGLVETIRKALKTDMDVYIAIRDTNIDDAVRVFDIGEYRIIPARD